MYNSQELETAQWLNGQMWCIATVDYLAIKRRELLMHLMGESQKHYAKLNEPDKNRYSVMIPLI